MQRIPVAVLVNVLGTRTGSTKAVAYEIERGRVETSKCVLNWTDVKLTGSQRFV